MHIICALNNGCNWQSNSVASDVSFASKLDDTTSPSVARSDDFELLKISKALAVAVVSQRERMHGSRGYGQAM